MKTKPVQLFVVLGIICSLMLISCEKEETYPIKVDKQEISLSTETTKATFTITTKGEWTITSPDIEVGYGIINYKSWYELDKTGGKGNGTVTVSVKKDAVPTEDNTATLTITGKSDKKTVLAKFKK